MRIRIDRGLKLAIILFGSQVQVILVKQNFFIFLVPQLSIESLEYRVVGKLKCLLNDLLGYLALSHSTSR